jgi:hypothetical protein
VKRAFCFRLGSTGRVVAAVVFGVGLLSTRGAATGVGFSWSGPTSVSSGATYCVGVTAHTISGTTWVNLYRDGQWLDGGYGYVETCASDTGPATVTYSADAFDPITYEMAEEYRTVTITGGAPSPQPPVVQLLSPGNTTVALGTAVVLSSRATDVNGDMVAHNLDIQRPDGSWNWYNQWGGLAIGEPFTGGPVGSAGDSSRSASFIFDLAGTWHVRAYAHDAAGHGVHSTTVEVVVSAGGSGPPPAPLLLHGSDIGDRTFQLNWISLATGPVTYEVRIGDATIGSVDTNAAPISGLLPATPYAVAVRARNADGQVSDWVTATVATLSAGAVPYAPCYIEVDGDGILDEVTPAFSAGSKFGWGIGATQVDCGGDSGETWYPDYEVVTTVIDWPDDGIIPVVTGIGTGDYEPRLGSGSGGSLPSGGQAGGLTLTVMFVPVSPPSTSCWITTFPQCDFIAEAGYEYEIFRDGGGPVDPGNWQSQGPRAVYPAGENYYWALPDSPGYQRYFLVRFGKPLGGVRVPLPGGITLEINLNGSATITLANGTTLRVGVGGVGSLSLPNGVTVSVGEGGIIDVTLPPGTDPVIARAVDVLGKILQNGPHVVWSVRTIFGGIISLPNAGALGQLDLGVTGDGVFVVQASASENGPPMVFRFTRPKVQVLEAGFSGPGNQVVWADACNAYSAASVPAAMKFTAPQWKDLNGDGIIDRAAGDQNFSTAFKRGSVVSVEGKLRIEGLSQNAAPVFRVRGPDGMETATITVPADKRSGDDFTVGPAPFQQALPNCIWHYDRTFFLRWQMSLDGGSTWSEVASTPHTIYVILETPTTTATLRQETLFWLGCKNALGVTDPSSARDLIYWDFRDCDVRRINPTTGGPGDLMYYWKYTIGDPETIAYHDARRLLASPDLNGACGGWANLLASVLGVQGIEAREVEVKPRLPDTGLLVHSWTFDSDPGGPSDYPYRLGIDLHDGWGVPSQGHPGNSPLKTFRNHFIVLSENTYFDPSYGSPPLANTWGLGRQLAYENAAFAGYGVEVETWVDLGVYQKTYCFRRNHVEGSYVPEVDFIPNE